MVTYAIDCGVLSMATANVISVAGLAALIGRIVCGLGAVAIVFTVRPPASHQPTLVDPSMARA